MTLIRYVQASCFPGFMDEYERCGRQVRLARKARALTADLFLRFKEEVTLFDFSDALCIGPDTGAEAIAYLRMQGCIDCSSSISEAISVGEQLTVGLQELDLRWCCDIALRLIASELDIGPWQVSRWIAHEIKHLSSGIYVLHSTTTISY